MFDLRCVGTSDIKEVSSRLAALAPDIQALIQRFTRAELPVDQSEHSDSNRARAILSGIFNSYKERDISLNELASGFIEQAQTAGKISQVKIKEVVPELSAGYRKSPEAVSSDGSHALYPADSDYGTIDAINIYFTAGESPARYKLTVNITEAQDLFNVLLQLSLNNLSVQQVAIDSAKQTILESLESAKALDQISKLSFNLDGRDLANDIVDTPPRQASDLFKNQKLDGIFALLLRAIRDLPQYKELVG